jgi:glycosyltransferase involved in cell wall biosynthesis
MRIGISTSVIQRGKTGVAQYVFALLRALLPTTKSHQFVLFVLREDLPLFEFVAPSMEIIAVDEQFRPPVRNILWHQTRLPRLVKTYGLDVLHIPSYRRMLWPRPCSLVATIHDLAPFHVSKKYDWKRMLYAKVFVRRLARRQDEIIAISENTARDIRAFFGLRERVTVVHNGLDHERFNPGLVQGCNDTGRRYGFEQPFFLYVARLEHPAKNHVRLISAFEQFKTQTGSKWQLIFAGSDWHGAEAIHEAIRRSPAASDIRTLGFVEDEQLPALYRAASAFVYPSLYEGFGMPPIEAMACGCPVISSARGSLKEVVGNAALIAEPEDVSSIANQLGTLAVNAQMRNKYRAAGLRQAAGFNWDDTATQTLLVYEKALHRGVYATSPAEKQRLANTSCR